MLQKFSYIKENNYNTRGMDKKEAIKIDYKKILEKIFTPANIILYIIAFAISRVSFLDDMNPFGMAFLAAAYVNNIPIFGVWIFVGISLILTFGKAITLSYILQSIVFVGLLVIFKSRILDEKEEVGIKLFLSILLVGFVSNTGKIFLLYDTLLIIMNAICTVIFYVIFSKAIPVVHNRNQRSFFNKEELVGASILIAISISALGEISIFNFSLRTVLSILVVLILGWKNGALAGTTAGLSIGVILAVMGIGDTGLIASYAFSGLVAGIFRRFGKAGVAIGFVFGNIILTFVDNNSIQPIIAIKEILIASVGLLAIPKVIETKIENAIGMERALPDGSAKSLGKVEDTIYALNSMSEVINDMSNNFAEVVATTTCEINTKLLEDLFEAIEKKTCSNCNYNKECMKMMIMQDERYMYKIIDILIQNDEITENDLKEIFEGNICYNTENLLLIINSQYQIYKLNNVWQKKVEENREIALNQLKGVSKAINTITNNLKVEDKEDLFELKLKIRKELELKNVKIKDITLVKETNKYIANLYLPSCEKGSQCKTYTIENILTSVLGEKMVSTKNNCAINLGSEICIQKYVSKGIYKINLGISRTTKNRSMVSGDSHCFMELEDGKFLIALSDGMGSGPKAECNSKLAIKMLERMLESGFDKCTALELINSSLALRADEETFSTIDMSVIDLYDGNIEFVKLSACPTYIKNNKGVELVQSVSLPVGILKDVDINLYDKKLRIWRYSCNGYRWNNRIKRRYRKKGIMA